jgi:hypothetical protein
LSQDGEIGFDALHLDAVALFRGALEVRTPVKSEITAAFFASPAMGLQVPALWAFVKQRLVTTGAELDAFRIHLVASGALHPSIVAVRDAPPGVAFAEGVKSAMPEESRSRFRVHSDWNSLTPRPPHRPRVAGKSLPTTGLWGSSI